MEFYNDLSSLWYVIPLSDGSNRAGNCGVVTKTNLPLESLLAKVVPNLGAPRKHSEKNLILNPAGEVEITFYGINIKAQLLLIGFLVLPIAISLMSCMDYTTFHYI